MGSVILTAESLVVAPFAYKKEICRSSTDSSTIGIPVEFPKAIAATMPFWKFLGAFVIFAVSFPIAAPIATNRNGSASIGHVDLSRFASMEGNTLEKSMQGIVICMESVDMTLASWGAMRFRFPR